MATYAEMLILVRDWANRDSSILSDTKIQQFLQYAADKAYRTLRIPALERTVEFLIEAGDVRTPEVNVYRTGIEILMTIPADMIEVIYLRKKNSGIVFTNKLSVDIFNDSASIKNDDNFWTRTGNSLILHGDLAVGDVIELHYYKRLLSIDYTYEVTPTNFVSQTAAGQSMIVSTVGGTSVPLYFAAGTTNASVATPTNFDMTTVSSVATATLTQAIYFKGLEASNWLRDENERILLFGALAETFMYLGNTEDAATYASRFQNEIDELNVEETKRRYKNGIFYINYHSNLI